MPIGLWSTARLRESRSGRSGNNPRRPARSPRTVRLGRPSLRPPSAARGRRLRARAARSTARPPVVRRPRCVREAPTAELPREAQAAVPRRPRGSRYQQSREDLHVTHRSPEGRLPCSRLRPNPRHTPSGSAPSTRHGATQDRTRPPTRRSATDPHSRSSGDHPSPSLGDDSARLPRSARLLGSMLVRSSERLHRRWRLRRLPSSGAAPQQGDEPDRLERYVG